MGGEKIPRIPATDKCNGRNMKRNGGKYCGSRAGWGTDHVGEGRCRKHGGNNPVTKGNRTTISRYSDHAVLGERIKRANESGDLLKIEGDLALLQAIVEDWIDVRKDRRFEDGELSQALVLIDRLIDAKKKAHDVGRAWTDARAEAFMSWIGEVVTRILLSHLGDDKRIPSIVREIFDEADGFRV